MRGFQAFRCQARWYLDACRVDGVETGAGLYQLVIDEVSVLGGVASLVFGMVIE